MDSPSSATRTTPPPRSSWPGAATRPARPATRSSPSMTLPTWSATTARSPSAPTRSPSSATRTSMSPGSRCSSASTPPARSARSTSSATPPSSRAYCTSIAIGTDGLPGHQLPGQRRRHAQVAKCGNVACSAGNTISIVDDPANCVGYYTSIAIGADGLPIISYYDQTAFTSRWPIAATPPAPPATRSPPSTTLPTSSGWYTSIAIGADGLPVISYRDDTAFALKVAHCGNAACSAGNTIITVDDPPAYVGHYTSIAIGTDGLPVISYCDLAPAPSRWPDVATPTAPPATRSPRSTTLPTPWGPSPRSPSEPMDCRSSATWTSPPILSRWPSAPRGAANEAAWTLAVLAVLLAGPLAAQPLDTAFTYQGRLLDAGAPASGPFDFRFILFDAPVGGSQVGPIVTRDDVVVTGGLFTVSLDFGTSAFTGNKRWLDIAIRPGPSGGSYTALGERQELQGAPHAGVRPAQPLGGHRRQAGGLRGRHRQRRPGRPDLRQRAGREVEWDGLGVRAGLEYDLHRRSGPRPHGDGLQRGRPRRHHAQARQPRGRHAQAGRRGGDLREDRGRRHHNRRPGRRRSDLGRHRRRRRDAGRPGPERLRAEPDPEAEREPPGLAPRTRTRAAEGRSRRWARGPA